MSTDGAIAQALPQSARDAEGHHHTNLSASYHLAMLVLSLYAIAALAAEAAMRLDPQIRTVLSYADYAVCALFACDFLLSLWRAPRRLRYLSTWGWLDLLSSVPVLSVARWGRVARVARVFRVLRGIKATKEISAVLLQQRARNTFLAVSLLALLLVVTCSIAILHFETMPEANIHGGGCSVVVVCNHHHRWLRRPVPCKSGGSHRGGHSDVRRRRAIRNILWLCSCVVSGTDESYCRR